MKLHIADNLTLPLDVVTQAIAVLGIRRSGKSYTVRRFAEQFTKAKQQVVIIDPKGDWWGIRSSADAKGPGLPITILGGEHGDIPLEVGAGELIAKLVAEQNASLLLDLSSFRKHEVAEFMGGKFGSKQQGFLEALYRLKAQERYRTPMALVIDEADAIAPQKPYKGEERMLGAAEDIVRRGGQRGIGCMVATQRPAVLNKNVLTQCAFLVALRMSGSQDIDAIDEWIKKHGNPEARKLLLDSIATQGTGTAWFWCPEVGIFQQSHVLPIETFDSGATPKAGEKRIEPKQLAPVDLAALRERMAETIERAKQDDPKTLRARIAELEQELRKKPAGAVQADPKQEQQAYERGFHAGLELGRKALTASAAYASQRMEETAESIRDNLAANVRNLEANKPPLRVTFSKGASPITPARLAPPPRRVQHTATNGELSVPERKILAVLAQRPEGVELDRLAVLSGYTVNGHFNNTLGHLRTKQFVSPPRVVPITITPEGLDALGDFEPLPTGEDLQRYWLNRLSTPEQRIMNVLFERRGEPIELEELAATCGYTVNGHFNNTLGGLRTKGLVSGPRLPIRAADEFFEESTAVA